MKRYYLDRLSIFESIIKALIINVLITVFLVALLLVAKYGFYSYYIYGFIIIYIIVLIYHLIRSSEKITFYIKDNAIIRCKKNEEVLIELKNIDVIEEYFGVNYLFGKKTIILHEKNKKHYFMLNKDRAAIFKNHLEDVINNSLELKDFNI